MGYIKKNLKDILDKIMGYILKNMGYIWKNYGIYWAKTIGYFIGYIRQKLWDILEKNYEIYWLRL